MLSVSVDGGGPVMVALDGRRAATLTIPPASHAGVRLDLAAERGAPPARLRAVTVGGAWPSAMVVLVLALLAGLATCGRGRGRDPGRPRRDRAGPGQRRRRRARVRADDRRPLRRMVRHRDRRGGRAARRRNRGRGTRAASSRAALARAALLVAALAFGAGARWVFAPSTGSWDMEYWRAWTESAIARGVTGAYGPPLPPGAFVPTLRGDEPLWMVTHDGRRFPIDYPPLALAAWRAAAALVPARDASSWNVALKLPALAGDLLAVAILSLVVAGKTRRRTRGRPVLGAARVLAVERDPRLSRRRVRAVRPRRRGGGGLRARRPGRRRARGGRAHQADGARRRARDRGRAARAAPDPDRRRRRPGRRRRRPRPAGARRHAGHGDRPRPAHPLPGAPVRRIRERVVAARRGGVRRYDVGALRAHRRSCRSRCARPA